MGVLNNILPSIHRLASSFLLTLAVLLAIFIGLYQYQNNWDELSQLPIIREYSLAYKQYNSFISQATLLHFYEISEGDVAIQSSSASLPSTTNSGQLMVYSTWNKDSIMQKLSFSKRKMRQAKHYVAYIEQYKNIALRDMYLHKVPASIKLAQGLLESNAGRSQLSTKTNNHFGIKARPNKTARAKIRARHYNQLHDTEFIPVSPAIGAMRFTDDHSYDRFEVYHDVGDSYLRHTQLLTRSCKKGRTGCYAWIWDAFSVGEDHSITNAAQAYYRASGISAASFYKGRTDVPYYMACAAGLKMAGYATSPTYHQKITYIIETYELWRFDIDLLRAVDANATK